MSRWNLYSVDQCAVRRPSLALGLRRAVPSVAVGPILVGKCLMAASAAFSVGMGSYVSAADAAPATCAPTTITVPTGTVDSVQIEPDPGAQQNVQWDGSNLQVSGGGWTVTITGIHQTGTATLPAPGELSPATCVGAAAGAEPKAPEVATPPAPVTVRVPAPTPSAQQPSPPPTPSPRPVAPPKPSPQVPVHVVPGSHKPASSPASASEGSSGRITTPSDGLHLLPLHLASLHLG